jgi:hypothetical protein
LEEMLENVQQGEGMSPEHRNLQNQRMLIEPALNLKRAVEEIKQRMNSRNSAPSAQLGEM